MNYEEQVKKKLWEVWKKEAIRIEKHNGGWERRKVPLGLGMGKLQGLKDVDDMLDIIEDFGIDLRSLGKMNPDYDQIYEIYRNIIFYRTAVRYLRQLKEEMNNNNGYTS